MFFLIFFHYIIPTHISRFSFSLLSRFILIFRIVVTCRRQVSFICPRISAIFRRRSRAAEAVRRVYERAAANGLDHPGGPPTVTGTRPCWVTRAYPRDGASSGILRTRSRAAKPGRRVYEEDANRSGKGRSAVPSRRGFPHLAPAPRKFVEIHPARRAWPGRQKPPAVSGTRPRRVAGTRPRRVVLMRPRASGFSRSRSRSSGVGRSTHVRMGSLSGLLPWRTELAQPAFGGSRRRRLPRSGHVGNFPTSFPLLGSWSEYIRGGGRRLVGWLLLRLLAPFRVSRRRAFPLLPLISAARWRPAGAS